MRPDIVVTDLAGREVLAVEAKARRNVDGNWAAELRRNLYAHGPQVRAAYFMIVTAESVFVWIEPNDEDRTQVRQPDATAPTSTLIPGVDDASLTDGRTLELVTSAWLGSIVRATDASELPDVARDFLVSTRLFEALRGAHVALEPA